MDYVILCLIYLTGVCVWLFALRVVWTLPMLVFDIISAVSRSPVTPAKLQFHQALTGYAYAAVVAGYTVYLLRIVPAATVGSLHPLLTVTGGITVYASYASFLRNWKEAAVMNGELRDDSVMTYIHASKYDGLLAFAALLLYVCMLWNPSLVITPWTLSLFRAMDWLLNLRFIGWLIRASAAWSVISTIGTIAIGLAGILIYLPIAAVGRVVSAMKSEGNATQGEAIPVWTDDDEAAFQDRSRSGF